MELKQHLCQTSAVALCTCVHLWLPSCCFQQAYCGIGDLVPTDDSNLAPSAILSLLFSGGAFVKFCLVFFVC